MIRSGKHVETRVLGPDDAIIEATLSARPALVVIDAPLSLPRGRSSLEVRSPLHFRACDLELRRLGIRFFPLTLGPMRMLTARGIRLKAALGAHGLRVVEGYPGGAQDLLGLPRKGAGSERLRRALIAFGFRGSVARREITHDELDAILCAWVGRLLLFGKALVIGDPDEGTMVLPSPVARRGPRRQIPKGASPRGT
jgi:uncharacterized protein